MIDGRMMVIGTVSPYAANQCPLAEGLRVGIGVGPPEGLGPGLADLDQLLLDPVLAEALGPLGEQVEPGPPELFPRALWNPARRSGRRDSASLSPRWRLAAVDLGAPVDLHAEPVPAEQLLLGLALVGTGHVRGRDREVVQRSAADRRPRPAVSPPRERRRPATDRAG